MLVADKKILVAYLTCWQLLDAELKSNTVAIVPSRERPFPDETQTLKPLEGGGDGEPRGKSGANGKDRYERSVTVSSGMPTIEVLACTREKLCHWLCRSDTASLPLRIGPL